MPGVASPCQPVTYAPIGSQLRDQLAFYSLAIAPIAAHIWLFAAVLSTADTHMLASSVGRVLFASKLLWFSGSVTAILNVIGLFRFGSPAGRDRGNVAAYSYAGWPSGTTLVVLYVSRGDNHQALCRALCRTADVLRSMQVAFRLEVVTDVPVEHLLRSTIPVSFYVVPGSYATERGAQYKARALQYALDCRDPIDEQESVSVWVLHMDEESVLTCECLAGIRRFVTDPRNADRIGQGEIKYNSFEYGKRPLITALDNMRTGDDLGRFRCQYALLHRPLFGMHGSFVLVPLEIERSIGFDLGARGSITEDAYFGLMAADRGIRFGWVDGFIQEQSPFSIGAIIRQRRRWFCGLIYLVFDPVLRLRTRICLLVSTVLWPLAPLGFPVTLACLLVRPTYFPLAASVLAGIVQGASASVYLVGAHRNMIGLGWPRSRRIFATAYTLALLPVSGAIEALALAYAIARPVRTFDVVSK
jgi:egghead protein (zeste-white 4 protein)